MKVVVFMATLFGSVAFAWWVGSFNGLSLLGVTAALALIWAGVKKGSGVNT